MHCKFLRILQSITVLRIVLVLAQIGAVANVCNVRADDLDLASGQEAELIRRARLEQQSDAGLRGQAAGCRYESSIPTAPPSKLVALTFDDGPIPGQTEYVISVLTKFNVPAAFFVIGERAKAHGELVEMIRLRSHVVGNHSWTHANFHSLSAPEQASQVLYEDAILGQVSLKTFRYPYGNASCETNELLHSLGYHIAGWHIDSCDWAFNRTGTVDSKDASLCNVRQEHVADYVSHVVASVKARNGGIVLMHENQPNMLHKLAEIIDQLKKLGFEFRAIDDPVFRPSLH